jgi:hypothetical protein
MVLAAAHRPSIRHCNEKGLNDGDDLDGAPDRI